MTEWRWFKEMNALKKKICTLVDTNRITLDEDMLRLKSRPLPGILDYLCRITSLWPGQSSIQRKFKKAGQLIPEEFIVHPSLTRIFNWERGSTQNLRELQLYIGPIKWASTELQEAQKKYKSFAEWHLSTKRTDSLGCETLLHRVRFK